MELLQVCGEPPPPGISFSLRFISWWLSVYENARNEEQNWTKTHFYAVKPITWENNHFKLSWGFEVAQELSWLSAESFLAWQSPNNKHLRM